MLVDDLLQGAYHLRITRDLQTAKAYLRERYSENPLARFGLIASSKDKDLVRFGIRNDYESTKRVRCGPWYSDDEDDVGHRSCRHLEDAVTEFGVHAFAETWERSGRNSFVMDVGGSVYQIDPGSQGNVRTSYPTDTDIETNWIPVSG